MIANIQIVRSGLPLSFYRVGVIGAKRQGIKSWRHQDDIRPGKGIGLLHGGAQGTLAIARCRLATAVARRHIDTVDGRVDRKG